jgi:hypothetical protein
MPVQPSQPPPTDLALVELLEFGCAHASQTMRARRIGIAEIDFIKALRFHLSK